ncbi:MAG: hypothetical protein U0Q15_15975 [Kineosporiaceae bacterium]
MTWDETASAGAVHDAELMERLRQAWTAADPVPSDLAERVTFALALDDVDFEFELLRLQVELAEPIGARGEDTLQTVTFSGESLSVMVSLSPAAAGGVRIDGWISDGGHLDVELHHADGASTLAADRDGRFAFERVPHGLVQLFFHPSDNAALTLPKAVATPALRV